jgi:serine/threonine-protein kinase
MGDPQAANRVGRVVGKYTLERVIGSGGMATVYEASHRNGNRVAVKMLKPAHAVTAEVRARFLREGYAANRVRHTGAVRVLDDHVTDDGLVFLVMELLEGASLDALARAHDGKLGVPFVLGIGKQLLEVLAAAHDAGIVHRDIKPENLFLQTTGKLKVLDFGIARILSAHESTTTSTGRMLGTPAFMPPEQAYGRRAEVDAQSDLWSAGATLFTAITGRVVHQAQTAEETLIKAATEAAPSLVSVALDVPPEVASLVDRSLMADKAARFRSAAEMLAALELAHVEAFGSPTPSTLRLDHDGAARSPAPRTMTKRERALRLAAWGAPIATIAALFLSGTAVRSEPRHDSRDDLASSSPPVPHLPPAPLPDVAPLAPKAESTENATTREVAPPQRARVAPTAPGARTGASANPAAPALTASVAPPSRACGFEFDEEGRKWPKRCP